MPLVVYDLNNAISDFFSSAETTATKEECDELAREICGGPIEPIVLQGVCSYTVSAVDGDIVVQFRRQDSLLNDVVLSRARTAHPEFVPSLKCHGLIGEVSTSGPNTALAVYSMPKLPGKNLVFIRHSLADSEPRERTTVRDLARFFAQSWLSARATDPAEAAEAIRVFSAVLSGLAKDAPARFEPSVTKANDLMAALRSGEYPVVLTHGDLNAMNMLVHPDSGHITGIVDWAEASQQPFGLALYALEDILSNMNQDSWRYFANADSLRAEFWRAFTEHVGSLPPESMKYIQLARAAGLLIRHGVVFSNDRFGPQFKVKDPTNSGWEWLDALRL